MSRVFLADLGKKALISVFLRRDILEKLRRLAYEQGLTASNYIEILVRKFYQANKNKLRPVEYTQTSFTITEDAKKLLDELARSAGLTAQNMLRIIIEEEVEKIEKRKNRKKIDGIEKK